MRKFIHLVYRTIFYDKKQSLAIFFSILISASLLSGIGTLIHCGVEQNYEKRKEIYGDWHLLAQVKKGQEENIEAEKADYDLEQVGTFRIVKEIENPEKITFVYLDEECREMLGRKLEEGTYPQNKNEIALDEYTITNLGISDKIGDEIKIGEETYRLSGIVSNLWSSNVGDMQAFVSSDYQRDSIEKNIDFLYFKFSEKNVYKKIERFVAECGIDDSTIDINDEIVDYVGGISIFEITEIVKEGFSLQSGKLGFILGTLKERCHLLERGVLFGIAIFCSFVIYSIFQIGAVKRIPQYGTMHAIGMERKHIFLILFLELILLLMVGYPVGSILGVLIVKIFFHKIGDIFVNQQIGDMQAGIHVSKAEQFMLYSSSDQGVFSVSLFEILFGAILMILLFLGISFFLMKKVEKMTITQAMKNQTSSKIRNRKIYAKTNQYLPNVLTRKFIFANKTASAAIILSVAIGGIVFLSGSFIIRNTQINNELSLKTDDGLGSDVQIYEQSENLKDVIGKEVVKDISEISGVKEVHAVSYTLGEVFFEKNLVLWDSYLAELANDPEWLPDTSIMEKYNGLGLRDENGDYRLKTNVYGYDDGMLDSLSEYIIEGSIDCQSLKQDNKVILKTWVDGQGNASGIDIHPGDTITLKVPKADCEDADVLKFLGPESDYLEKEFVIGAIVSRPMAKNTCYIGDDGTSSLDIIMTNEQMQENFQMEGYNMACIQLEEQSDVEAIIDQVAEKIQNVKNCMMKDYTGAISAHKEYLNQRKYFYVFLTFILLLISMFHMTNSMNFLLHARKYEIGILRAMGMTKSRFLRMMIKEASIYGIAASIVMLVFFIPIREVLFFMMKAVWLYIMPEKVGLWNEIVTLIFFNIFISVLAIGVPVHRILKEDIIVEIKK